MTRILFNPFSLLMLLFLVMVAVFVLPLLFLSVVGGAFTSLGFTWREAMFILLLTLAGSFVNIPVRTIRGRPVRLETRVDPLFGRVYRIPVTSPTTTLAVNLGGAVIPVAISLYLLYRSVVLTGGVGILVAALTGIAIVAAVTHRVARPVRGLGIAIPFYIPPLVALFCAVVLAVPFGGGWPAVVIAYTAGTLGTLIGADLLNLDRITDLGAPMASIGGAGTFDGVFLSGVIAAFLA